MKQTFSFFSFFSLFSILVASALGWVLAGGALSGLQNWAQFQWPAAQAAALPAGVLPGSVPSGIRLISSQAERSEGGLTHASAAVNADLTAVSLDSGMVKKPTLSVPSPAASIKDDTFVSLGSEPDSKSDPTPRSYAADRVPLASAPSLQTDPVLPLASAETESAQKPETSQLRPTVVVYEKELVIEFPQAIASEAVMRRAVARLLLSDRPFGEDLLSREPFAFQHTPYFYQKVLDHRQQPVRYPASALQYADHLLASDHRVEMEDAEGRFVALHIPLVPPAAESSASPLARYRDWVEHYAKTFSVPPELVFAVMETESNFKPDAVSRSNALGLMQIKAAAAGKDIYQHIDFKPGMPQPEELFDEQNNIRIGTAYLGLLKHEYLAEVRDPQTKEMLSIASYNGGLSTVLNLFGDTPQKALARINQLHPRQVYRKLRFEHQSDETRRYLDKVLSAQKRYQQLLKQDV